MEQPSSWINDGHKIELLLDGDQVFPKTVCPYEEGKHGLETACCRNEGKGPCGVREHLNDIGFEANCTGLTILCRDAIPIEYGWTGPDEFWFKVCGYPTAAEVRRQRKELALVLLGDEDQHLKVPEHIVEQMSFQSWFDLDDETKQNIKEDWKRHQEMKADKKDKPEGKKRAKKALDPKSKPKHTPKPQPKINLDEDDDEDDDGVAKDEDGNPIDPLLVQAEALPTPFKGSEGNRPNVLPADGSAADPAVELSEDAMDPKPGEGDGMSMTADD